MLSEIFDAGEYHTGLYKLLEKTDRQLWQLIEKEYDRQRKTLQLIAAENICSRQVLAALGSIVQNKTAEGFPGMRYHGGCEVVDSIEKLAARRACEAFGASYANVQPHSGTQANQIVLTALLEKDDRILCLGTDQGGHPSHGADVSFAGKFFQSRQYTLDRCENLLDYTEIYQKAREFNPKLIICGATAYARTIDFEQFRRIADEVGAYLMADISHIAGLVMAGAHPSPVQFAHFTTTSTYKPGGPRGGLILMGKDKDLPITVNGVKMPLWQRIEKTTFPGVQGTPYFNNIAAKAVFFKETQTAEFKDRQFRIIENAQQLASNMLSLGYDVVTGGTDNHMVMVNIANSLDGMTGVVAQGCLEDCGISVNMIQLPYDELNAQVTSGMRLGTPVVTRNGMGPDEMDIAAELVDTVLRKVEPVGQNQYRIDGSFAERTRQKVERLCENFPIR